MDEQEEKKAPRYLFPLTVFGFLCLGISSICMHLMTQSLAAGEDVFTILMIARLFGITGFLVGVLCLLNEKWTPGALLLLLSIILPFISLLTAGSL